MNFGPLVAEIVSLVWGTPGNFSGFRVLAALLHGTLVVGVSQTAAFNRGRHLYSAGRPSRWALAHISSCICCAHCMASVQSAVIVCLQLSNGEMFWVVTEVCSELNVARRAKIVKHFIQIASKFLWQITNAVLVKIDQHLLMQIGSIQVFIHVCLVLCGFLVVAYDYYLSARVVFSSNVAI